MAKGSRRKSGSKSRYHRKAMRSWELGAETRAEVLAAQAVVKVTKVEPGLTLAEMRERIAAGGNVVSPTDSPD